jgi:hypothetical protein
MRKNCPRLMLCLLELLTFYFAMCELQMLRNTDGLAVIMSHPGSLYIFLYLKRKGCELGPLIPAFRSECYEVWCTSE